MNSQRELHKQVPNKKRILMIISVISLMIHFFTKFLYTKYRIVAEEVGTTSYGTTSGFSGTNT